jgi:hypothetical protein
MKVLLLKKLTGKIKKTMLERYKELPLEKLKEYKSVENRKVN